jgi:predicted transcriptional regulator
MVPKNWHQEFGMSPEGVLANQNDGFSRREREIMDALYKLGHATAAQIVAEIPDPPSNTAVRTLLTILEKKGHVHHRLDGVRYIYAPSVARAKMAQKAVKSVLATFFDNSVEGVVAALLNQQDTKISAAELDRLSALIEKAKEEGR